MKILPLVIFATTILQAADPVLPAGAKPRNLGSVGAGEGPAWDGKGTLLTSLTNTASRFATQWVESAFFVNLLMTAAVCFSILKAGS